ncbi:hypothetical protein AB1L42_01550 [Thalassoglobus sp. JC818]|uniref:hypothetical protein n=1 Tax=Thalassoglobus sp. JC818 TaxID=3232136 RepID=UPI0034577969
MSTIEVVTGSYIDGELNDVDIDPMFALIELVSDVAEDFLSWYEETTDFLEESNDWMVWLSGVTAQGRSFSDESLSERTEFTEWLDSIGFDFKQYFNTSSSITTKIKSDYEVSEVLELLSLEIESLSSHTDQVSLFSNALIGDVEDGNNEFMNIVDTLRSSARGHIR